MIIKVDGFNYSGYGGFNCDIRPDKKNRVIEFPVCIIQFDGSDKKVVGQLDQASAKNSSRSYDLRNQVTYDTNKLAQYIEWFQLSGQISWHASGGLFVCMNKIVLAPFVEAVQVIYEKVVDYNYTLFNYANQKGIVYLYDKDYFCRVGGQSYKFISQDLLDRTF